MYIQILIKAGFTEAATNPVARGSSPFWRRLCQCWTDPTASPKKWNVIYRGVSNQDLLPKFIESECVNQTS